MHQAEARHVGAHASFEHRIIVGAKFHFHRPEFVFADFFLLHFADHFIVCSDGSVGSKLRAVINLRDHLRRAVSVENVHSPFRSYRNLLFENELAVDASGASTMQNTVQNRHGVPVFFSARRNGVADG